MEKEIEIINIVDFLSEAFCIDGKCTFVKAIDVNVSENKTALSSLFRLTDSKKGEFYVTLGSL